MAAPRLRVATVWADRPPWSSEVRILAASVRMLGGALSSAQFVAYHVTPADRETLAFLRDLDVEVRAAPELRPGAPYYNKLHMYEETDEYDWLLALDGDVAVARDPSAFCTGNAVRARAAARSPLDTDGWAAVYEAVGLTLPAERLRMVATYEEVPPYFNGGVLIVPSQQVVALRERLWEYAAVLESVAEKLPRERKRPRSTVRTNDQTTLALACASGIPFDPLPLEGNLTRHVHRSFRPDDVDPCLLHYMHRFGTDLRVSRYWLRRPDAAIRRVNRALDPVFERSRFDPAYLLYAHAPVGIRRVRRVVRGPALRRHAAVPRPCP